MSAVDRGFAHVMAVFCVALVSSAPLDASAYSGNPAGLYGRTNKSGGAGCAGGCHGSTGTTVAITGAAALDKGQTSAYTVTLTRTVGNGTRAGLAVAASDASILGNVAGMPTTLQSGASGNEVIHSTGVGSLRTITSNSATYQFNVSVPAGAATGTTYTLYAAGAVQYTGGFAHASNFTVKVKPSAPTSITPSNLTSGSVDLAWSGTGPHYRVVYKTGAAAPTSPTDGTPLDLAAATSTTVTGLAPSTQYSFAVYAKLNPDNIFSTNAATTTATTTASVAAARYVNAATGVNTGGCTVPASPCKTITYAMSQAVAGTPGDAINVAPGTYDVALGEAFPIVVKSGVQLKSTGTAENTVIDASAGNSRVLHTAAAANASTLVEGFTITGGFNQPAADGTVAVGGGMFIDGGSPTISKNIVIANEVRGYDGTGSTFVSGGQAYGGGLYGTGTVAPVIVNNIFSGNRARGGAGKSNPGLATPGSDGGSGQGGAIHLSATGTARIQNNTVYDNHAVGGAGGSSLGAGGGGGSAFYGAIFSDGLDVNNNILAKNTSAGGAGGGGSPAGSTGFASYGAMLYNDAGATNNLFFGNLVNGAPSSGDSIGNNSRCVFAPPCSGVGFYSEPTNLRITTQSPGAGTGTATGAPTDDMDGVTRANPPSIGAFEAVDPTNTYNLVLEGWQQVSPYVVTPAGGAGTATYNTVTRQLTLNLPYSGLTGTETMAHIHGPAARGANAGVLFTLAAGSPKTDTVTLSPTQETQLFNGQLYVNIHTSPSYANGEIRAQIDNVGATVTRVLTVAKTGTGAGTVTGAAEPGTVVNCGSDCTETVPHGKVVTLTATASAGSAFSGWSGACTGIGQCVVTMDAAKSATATFTLDSPPPPPNPPRLANISTRGPVLTGDDVLIGGLIIGGSTNKTVVVRARGPSLTATGVPGVLANPLLQLFSGQTQIAANDNWGDAANAATLQSSGFAPADPLESAIYTSLAPGPYTAIVSGVSATTGVGIVEIFEVDQPATPLINIATRGRVLTGNNVMIAGLIIQGSGPQSVVVRARGPSLAATGVPSVLANPLLQLFSGQTQIGVNDNWGEAANAAQIQASGFAPADPFEAAILVTLQPGAYTAIVTGVGGTTGVAIVEVFKN